MKTVIFFGATLLCGFAIGQAKSADDVKMKTHKDVKTSSAPVTRAEASKVFDRGWNSLVKGLKVKGANPVKIVSDGTPITKNEILAAFQSIVSQVQPMFKRSASVTPHYVSRLRKDFDQTKYLKLIRDGFVMPVGPLVVGKDGPVSTFEFGDAVGVLLIRISDLIHMPVRKFSPNLMGGKGT